MFKLRRDDAKKAEVFQTLKDLGTKVGDRLATLAQLQLEGNFVVQQGEILLSGYGVYLNSDDLIIDCVPPFPGFSLVASEEELDKYISCNSSAWSRNLPRYKERAGWAKAFAAKIRRDLERGSFDWEASVRRWEEEVRQVDEALIIFTRDQILLVRFKIESSNFSSSGSHGGIH